MAEDDDGDVFNKSKDLTRKFTSNQLSSMMLDKGSALDEEEDRVNIGDNTKAKVLKKTESLDSNPIVM